MIRPILAAIAIACIGTAASACRTPADMRDHLSGQYDEVSVAVLPESDGASLILYVDPDGRSWTIARVANGRSCIVAYGSDAQSVSEILDARTGEPL